MKKAWLSALSLLHKHAEIVRYAIVGVLTTAVNFTVYLICTRLLFPSLMSRSEELYALVFNCIAWAVAVTFAFFADRAFVFRRRERGGALLLQLFSFVALRVASGAVENLTPSLLIALGTSDLLAKSVVSVAVIILNYVFAKFITFARVGKKEKTAGESKL